LWPHSTLGWPEKTPELEYFYPTSTLITSRDIITLWVARMVLAGLNNVGEVPFREVYIHPKILDGYGETMSKSKGNGVDPIDVIDRFGADALRFGLAWLATETQDVRMPVQFVCPHCETSMNQTKQNREKPVVACGSCKKEFSTQWAKDPADKKHPRGAVTSERFEAARNFCNKLWNASRFVMINLEGFKPVALQVNDLQLEDRWILSRLSTTIEDVNKAIEEYRHADAVRAAYDFAWDEFCSYYVEIAKPRMQDAETRPVVQQVLAHTLDQLLRLLHPVIPFITEAIWQELAAFGTERVLAPASANQETKSWLMQSSWPAAVKEHQNPEIEAQFARFASVLGGLNKIRSLNNIPPKEQISFTVSCTAEEATLLQPMRPYLMALAKAECAGIGENLASLEMPAEIAVDGMQVTVDLGQFIDVEAEIQRNEKELANITKQIGGKKGKLSNENFVARAPAEVVEKEKAALADLEQQLEAVKSTLEKLRASSK
jgi:valyl-tRNA synthetase